MPLRDFDQVRERIQLRVEVRHIAQGIVLVLALVGAAFGVGVWYARQQPAAASTAVAASREAPANGAPAAAVAVAEAVTPVAEGPIVPKPVEIAAVDAGAAPHEAETPVVASAAPPAVEPISPEPTSELLATAPDERAVPPAETGISAAPFAPTEVAKVAPPAPDPPPPAPAHADVAPAAPVAPRVAVVAAPPAAAIAKVAAPHGLGLFGTLRMAPTLVSAAPVAPRSPVVAPVEDKLHVTQVHKIVVRPKEDDARPPPVSGHYVIQVKAFRDEAEAKSFEADLRGKGHAPKLTSIEVPEKGTFYRVRLGPFDSLEAARAAQKQFETAEGHVTILLAVP